MKRYIHSYLQFLAVAVLLLSSCVNHPAVPSSSKEVKCQPAIFPDYCDVTVPCNIAPLNFMLPAGEYEACIARLTTPDGQQQTYGSGVKVQIPESEWHDMLQASKGNADIPHRSRHHSTRNHPQPVRSAHGAAAWGSLIPPADIGQPHQSHHTPIYAAASQTSRSIQNKTRPCPG